MALGLWNVNGVNLPDLGVSENPIVQTFFPSAQGVNNPAFNPNATGLSSGVNFNQQSQPLTLNAGTQGGVTTGQIQDGINNGGLTMGGQPEVKGDNTIKDTNGGGTPPPPGDTKQQQYAKMAAEGSLNPVQRGEYEEMLRQAGASNQDFQRQINDAYAPQSQYLDQQEAQLRADQPNVLKDAMSQFEVALSGLDTAKSGVLGQVGQSAQAALKLKDDALTAARRMFDELRRGYQQRFGGSTSAGGAASEISAVEQQRQMGQTNRSYGETVQKIEQQKLDIENNYTTNKLDLEKQKTAAINQVNRDFQNQLMNIQNNRTQLASAKAQASLQALQDLRNQVFQINSQATQYAQTLDQQKQQAAISLDTYAKQLAMAGQGAQSAVQNSGINTNPTNNLAMAGTQKNVGSEPYVGPINSQGKRWNELQQRYI